MDGMSDSRTVQEQLDSLSERLVRVENFVLWMYTRQEQIEQTINAHYTQLSEAITMVSQNQQLMSHTESISATSHVESNCRIDDNMKEQIIGMVKDSFNDMVQENSQKIYNMLDEVRDEFNALGRSNYTEIYSKLEKFSNGVRKAVENIMSRLEAVEGEQKDNGAKVAQCIFFCGSKPIGTEILRLDGEILALKHEISKIDGGSGHPVIPGGNNPPPPGWVQQPVGPSGQTKGPASTNAGPSFPPQNKGAGQSGPPPIPPPPANVGIDAAGGSNPPGNQGWGAPQKKGGLPNLTANPKGGHP
jgi:uncharacterized protein YukE